MRMYISLQRQCSARRKRAINLCICPCCRLHDVSHRDRRLYLVFEYLDFDLKKLMDTTPNFRHNHNIIKVSRLPADKTDYVSTLIT
jgi:hypothetical protein